MPETLAMPKKTPAKTSKPLPPCKVVCIAPANRGGQSFAAERRKTIHGPYGSYKIVLARDTPVLLAGQHELDAFAEELRNGNLRELQIQPDQLESIAREVCDEAVASEMLALRAEVATLRGLLSDDPEAKQVPPAI